MNRLLQAGLVGLVLMPALAHAQFGSSARPPSTVSGLDKSAADPAVRVQDDAYRAVTFIPVWTLR